MRRERTLWVERVLPIVNWLIVVLLAVFVTLVLFRASHAAQQPVRVAAQDVSYQHKGGADYTHYRGHLSNQFERDAMEQSLANVWLPQVVAYMRAMGKPCASNMSNAWSQIPVIYRRLDAVHQYRGGVLGGGTWQVTPGGRHYQIEYYQMQHAHNCSLSAGGKAPCALLATPDLLDLLDLHVANGLCAAGATFALAVTPPIGKPLDGLVAGKQTFPILDAASEAALIVAEEAHHASVCGATPLPADHLGLKPAQDAYIALASSLAEAHFRMPQPFKGGCDPKWTPDECCKWRALEHREYTAWAKAERLGRWGEVDCIGERHVEMHRCANLYGPFQIRMPPCTFGSYPDDTDPVTCQQYLASQP